MKKLFLQGDRFVGKSTLLKKLLLELELTVSGFYVERWLDKQGKIIGFELCDANQLGQKKSQPNPEHCFIQKSNGRFKQKLSIFETYGKQLLETAQHTKADVILLDEIGGIELQVANFTQSLFQLLKRSCKVIGVYKSDQNFRTQRLPETTASLLLQKRTELYQAIIQQNGQLLTLGLQNKAVVEQQLKQLFLA